MRAKEGCYAVEAVLPGAQHRETGASRVRAVGKAGEATRLAFADLPASRMQRMIGSGA